MTVGGRTGGSCLFAACGLIGAIVAVGLAVTHHIKGYAATILAHVLVLAAIAPHKAGQATRTVELILAARTVVDAVAY